MSIASEIARIKKDKEALRQALLDKGAVLTEGALLAEYAAAVDSISVGESELPEATWEVVDNEVRITAGSIGDTTITIPTGRVYVIDDSISVDAGYVFDELIDLPATSLQRNGDTVYAERGWIYGEEQSLTIPAATLAISGGSVVVSTEGYVKEDYKLTLPTAEITETETSVTIGVGYVAEEKTYQLSAGDTTSIRFGVIDEDGKFQPLDVTVAPPTLDGVGEDGEYYILETGLPYPDDEGAASGGGIAQLVKVVEFSLPHGEMQGVSAISVSGFGVLETYDGDIDFSAWNGTYNVTTETKFKEEEKQVFKHTSSNQYIFRMYNEEYEEYQWAFGNQPSASSLDNVEFYSSNLSNGSWNNYQYDVSVDLTLDKTTTDYPAQGLVLNVVPAENFTVENDIRTWSFGAPIALAAYEEQPEIGPIYAMLNGTTLSNIVYPQEIQGVNGLIFSGDMTSDTPLLGTFTVSGSVTYSTSGVLLENKYLTPSIEVEDFSGDFTLIFDVLLESTARVAVFAAFDADQRIGIDTNGGTYNIWAGNSGWNILEADSGYSESETSGSGRGSISITPNAKQHIVFTRTGDIWELYVNGVRSLRRNRAGTITIGGKIVFNRWGNGGYMSSAMQLGNVKMYKRGATETEKTSEE